MCLLHARARAAPATAHACTLTHTPRRKIHNPRILLMDCPLEYKKGESQTNVELTREADW